MRTSYRVAYLIILIAAVAILIFIDRNRPETILPEVTPAPSATASATPTPTPEPTPTPKREVIEPIAEFKARITKKSFGTYVTPQNSPVSPERFTGYHVAVDIEYADVTSDIPVVAIADGTVVASRTADGYGGVMVIQHRLGDQIIYAVYGHLRPSTMLTNGTQVTQGRQIGLLGTAYSEETDGERRHLHFGISKANSITGYIANKSSLSSWIDPLTLFP